VNISSPVKNLSPSRLVPFAYAISKQFVQLMDPASHPSQTLRSGGSAPDCGPHASSQSIANFAASGFSRNLLGATPCGFRSVNSQLSPPPFAQLFSSSSRLFHLRDSHATSVSPQKTLDDVQHDRESRGVKSRGVEDIAGAPPEGGHGLAAESGAKRGKLWKNAGLELRGSRGWGWNARVRRGEF
jgi:hypothetical protein